MNTCNRAVILMAVVFALGLHGIAKKPNLTAGPFSLMIHKAYKCKEPLTGPNVWKYNLNLQQLNTSSALLTSNITLPNGIHDGIKGSFAMAVLENGAWKKNYINIKFNKICTEMQTVFPKLIRSLMLAAGQSDYKGCPIKKGTYNVRNWTMDFNTYTGIFPYNTYMAEIQLFEGDTKVLCINADVDVIPKV